MTHEHSPDDRTDPTPHPRIDLSDLSLGGSSFGMPVPLSQDLLTRQAHIYDAVCGMQRHLNGAEGIPGFLGTVQLLSTILLSPHAQAALEEQLPDIVERADRLMQLRTSLRDRLEELKEMTKAVKSGTDEITHIIYAMNKFFGATMRAGDAEKAKRERDSARRKKSEDGDFSDGPEEVVEEKPAPKKGRGKKAAEPEKPPAPLAYDDPARPRLFSDTAPDGAISAGAATTADPRQVTLDEVLAKDDKPPVLAPSLLGEDEPEPAAFDPALSAELDKLDADRAPSSRTIGEFDEHDGEGIDHSADPASEGMVGDDGDLDGESDAEDPDAPIDDGIDFAETPPPLGDTGYNKDLNPDLVMLDGTGMMLVPRKEFNELSVARQDLLFKGFDPKSLKPEQVKRYIWEAKWEARTSEAGTQYAVAVVVYDLAATLLRVLQAMSVPHELRTPDGRKPAVLTRRPGRPSDLPVLPE